MFVSMFAAKYELNLVAGNFINSIGGGAAVDELLCRFSCLILRGSNFKAGSHVVLEHPSQLLFLESLTSLPVSKANW